MSSLVWFASRSLRLYNPGSVRWMSSAASTAASSSSPDTEQAEEKKKPRFRGKSLFEVTDVLPQNGKGARVARRMWKRYEEPCYWTLTRIKYPHAVKGGEGRSRNPKAWGKLTWRGQTSEDESEVRSTHKREWVVFPGGTSVSETTSSETTTTTEDPSASSA